MLRRVARVLRAGLFVLGAPLLICLPVSFLYQVGLELPIGDRKGVSVGVARGVVILVYLRLDDYQPKLGFDFGPAKVNPYIAGQLWPDHLSERYPPFVRLIAFAIPLWLLSALCLAWPVTSFILHRRKRKRGFPIEPLETPRAATTGM